MTGNEEQQWPPEISEAEAREAMSNPEAPKWVDLAPWDRALHSLFAVARRNEAEEACCGDRDERGGRPCNGCPEQDVREGR